MALTKEKVVNITAQAMKIVEEQCKTIKPKGYFFSYGPRTAWIYELYFYASALANADGAADDDEIQACFDMLCRHEIKTFTDTGLKVLGKHPDKRTQKMLDEMPYALDELIARDNAAGLTADSKIPVSIWYFYIIYWLSVFIIQADEKADPRELSYANPVLSRIHQNICRNLELPEETVKELIQSILMI